jgi:hypothetical protein
MMEKMNFTVESKRIDVDRLHFFGIEVLEIESH